MGTSEGWTTMADSVELSDDRFSVRVAVAERYALLRSRLPNHVVWTRGDMRVALANRDVASIYRLLQRYGMSQRVIASLTGQSQSGVSEIIKGSRVVSYEVLLRIADGFGIPRGRMGLAFDEETEAMYAGLEHKPGAPRPLWEIVDGHGR
jgi:hypothetical protein